MIFALWIAIGFACGLCFIVGADLGRRKAERLALDAFLYGVAWRCLARDPLKTLGEHFDDWYKTKRE